MTNILFMIVRICHFQFKCSYLKNEKPFLNLLLHFRNLHQILNVSKKRMIVIANVFPKLQKVKILVRHWLQVINILFKIVRFSNSQFRCKYLKTEKLLLDCFFHFRKLHQILYILKKKMIVIATAFPNLRIVNSLVRSLSKKGRFGTRFDTQYVKLSKILAKSPWEPFDHVFSSFSRILISKMRRLVLGQISGVFVNTLNADHKYPFEDCENLPLTIQMQLS